jgi:hypothetical protein
MLLSNPLLPSHTVVTQAHRLRFFGTPGGGGLVFDLHATSTLTPFCEYFATEEMWVALPPGVDGAPPRVAGARPPPAPPGGCRLVIGVRLVFSKDTIFAGRIRSETESAVRTFSNEYVDAVVGELARARREGEPLARWGLEGGGSRRSSTVEEGAESSGGGGGGSRDPAHWPEFAQRLVAEQAALSRSVLELREALAAKVGEERGGLGTLGGLLRAIAPALDGVSLSVAVAAVAVLWALRLALAALLR